MTGLYALRPSYNKIPLSGCVNSLDGQESVLTVVGPMCGSLGGLYAFMRAVVEAKPWRLDPLMIRKGWDADAYALADRGGRDAKLCYAIMWDNGRVRPHPPILRAMELAKEALVSAHHTGAFVPMACAPFVRGPLTFDASVIDWKPKLQLEMYNAVVCSALFDSKHGKRRN